MSATATGRNGLVIIVSLYPGAGFWGIVGMKQNRDATGCDHKKKALSCQQKPCCTLMNGVDFFPD